MNTKVYLQIKEKIENADAIIIGAGAGLSTASGVNYGTTHFEQLFPELVQTYGFTDMYTSSFYHFLTEEEKWSYWAKHIHYLCTGMEATYLYKKLYELFIDKNYFIITTNVDRQFLKAGFDPQKVFEVQGALSKIQCAKGCHNQLYDDTHLVKEMLACDHSCKIPSKMVPKCPVCGGWMEVNLRKDCFFVEDDDWEEHRCAYEKFIHENKDKKVLFLEFGAGFNTPGIIRYPFESLTKNMKDAFLIRVNDKFADVPNYISEKSIGIQTDICEFLKMVGDFSERENVISIR
jgi:NAD-dependent SIR2 family protein deacetylase